MNYRIQRLSPFRLASIYAYEAVGTGHNMYALLEIDVTGIRRELRIQRREGVTVSFFGLLLGAIARTIGEDGELNHIRRGKKIYLFDEVDISTAIELELDGTPVPRLCVVRDAARKTAVEITREIEASKREWREAGSSGAEDRWAQRGIALASFLPGFLYKAIIRRLARDPLKMKESFGTTYVTSVGGFSDASGFVIPYIEGKGRPLTFAIGNVSRRADPGKPGVREYLSLTIQINHDLVDGARAARFVDRLKQRIEGRLP